MKIFAFTLSLLLALSFTAFSQDRYSEFVKKFDYDAKNPLDVQETNVEMREGARVYTVSYASLKGGRIPAYLVVPEKKGKHAGIVFGHWRMQNSPMRNRTEFLDEAVVLAKAGVVSILPDAPFARPGYVEEKEILSDREGDYFFQHVLDLRRAVDLLAARKDVDRSRIAYVGHSYSANAGGVLAGVEKRFKALVLMASGLSDADDLMSNEPEMVEFRKSIGEEKVKDFIAKHAWSDPFYYVSHAAPSVVFLQYGKNDGFISRRTDVYYKAVSDPKEMKLYDAGHALNNEARRDRYEFLRRHLKLKRIDSKSFDNVKEIK